MFCVSRSLRAGLFALAALAMPVAGATVARAADMPATPSMGEVLPEVSASEFLDRTADLMLLRLRFGAMLQDEVRDRMRATVLELGDVGPSADLVDVLRRDLTAELYYYTVNLRYLIMAEGAIWPEGQSARTYRLDSLAELATIVREIASGDVLRLDIEGILHRLEQVNAWTEGLSEPLDDWFDSKERKLLVEEALAASESMTRT
ncbi:MAG: hypothetical protein KKH72_09820 [Alphaproteobacteria bacterium]|nr:hypothetical protein [Alphaproteobacteria bacterium]